jgi:phosphatidylserine synthase
MWCGSLVYSADHGVMSMANMLHDTMIIPIAVVILSLLLVSEIPMFSIKFKKGSEYNRIRIYFLIFAASMAVATILMGINWSYIILLTFTCYILLNILNAIFSLRITRTNK